MCLCLRLFGAAALLDRRDVNLIFIYLNLIFIYEMQDKSVEPELRPELRLKNFEK